MRILVVIDCVGSNPTLSNNYILIFIKATFVHYDEILTIYIQHIMMLSYYNNYRNITIDDFCTQRPTTRIIQSYYGSSSIQMSAVPELRNSAENAIRGSARKGSDGTCGENVKT